MHDGLLPKGGREVGESSPFSSFSSSSRISAVCPSLLWLALLLLVGGGPRRGLNPDGCVTVKQTCKSISDPRETRQPGPSCLYLSLLFACTAKRREEPGEDASASSPSFSGRRPHFLFSCKQFLSGLSVRRRGCLRIAEPENNNGERERRVAPVRHARICPGLLPFSF